MASTNGDNDRMYRSLGSPNILVSSDILRFGRLPLLLGKPFLEFLHQDLQFFLHVNDRRMHVVVLGFRPQEGAIDVDVSLRVVDGARLVVGGRNPNLDPRMYGSDMRGS